MQAVGASTSAQRVETGGDRARKLLDEAALDEAAVRDSTDKVAVDDAALDDAALDEAALDEAALDEAALDDSFDKVFVDEVAIDEAALGRDAPRSDSGLHRGARWTRLDECPICMLDTNLVTRVPCGHRTCLLCACRCLASDARCPICRTVTCGLEDVRHLTTRRASLQRVLTFGSRTAFAGITLRNDGDRVVVSKLNPHDCAQGCGFRVGDTILSINNIWCDRHDRTVQMIESARDCGVELRCLVIPHRPPTLRSRLWRRLARMLPS